MNNEKDKITAAISRARADLDKALEQVEHLPAFDPGTVGFAAHALNNYLTVIDGTAQLLQDLLQDHAEKDVHRWLDGMRHANELMRHTVHQLMNMSLKDNSVLKLEDMELPVLVERASGYYRRIAARKNIAIEYRNSSKTPHVWADRVAVAAVLDNLLSNAVKYSPPGTTVYVDVSSDPGGLVCVVQDEGPGINQTDRAKLFQKGMKLTARPTGGESSTGFGLAVAKELITRVGGEIWHEPRESGGSCFCLRLPYAAKASPN